MGMKTTGHKAMLFFYTTLVVLIFQVQTSNSQEINKPSFTGTSEKPFIIAVKPTEQELSLSVKYISVIVVLLIFVLGQIVIPLCKTFWEQQRSKKHILTVMKAIVEKSLDFFGETKQESNKYTVLNSIANEITKAESNDKYYPHISVTKDIELIQIVFKEKYFWLIDDKIVNAFVRFNEYALRTGETCQTVNSEEFKLLVKKDRLRYINALKEIERQHTEWLVCTKELAHLLKETLIKS